MMVAEDHLKEIKVLAAMSDRAREHQTGRGGAWLSVAVWRTRAKQPRETLIVHPATLITFQGTRLKMLGPDVDLIYDDVRSYSVST